VIDGRRATALLNAASIAAMNALSGLQAAADDDEGNAEGALYGVGIRVRQVKNGLNLWHSGSLPGTQTIAARTADGFAWVAAFNSRPQDRIAFHRELDRGLWTAESKVKKWPDGDLLAHRP